MLYLSAKLVPDNDPNHKGTWCYIEVPRGREERELYNLVPIEGHHIVSLHSIPYPVESKECLTYTFDWDSTYG